MGHGQGRQHLVTPVAPRLLQQLAAAVGQVAQRLVIRQHRGAGARVECLVAGIDVAQAAALSTFFAVHHVVPRGGRAGVVLQRCVDVDVGHTPGRITQPCSRCGQHGGWVLHHPGGDKYRQRHDALLRLPALHRLGAVVQCIDLDPVAQFADTQHGAAGVQAVAQRRGQALGEPAVAFGPGQHAFGFIRFVAGCMEAMAAGEVVDASPGRHRGRARAKVVAAAVVEVPAQVRVGKVFGVEPVRKRHRVQRLVGGRERRTRCGHAEPRLLLQLRHTLRKTLVLRQCAGPDAVHRQQAFLPRPFKEQPLLRAVAQVAFVIHPAPGLALAQAQFFEQILHLVGIVARHRQVMRAQRAGDAFDLTRTAVAASAVFQLQQREVVNAAQPQRPRCGQPCDTAPGD